MTEHQIQSAFIKWVRLAEKQDDRLKLSFAIPNAGKRTVRVASMMKAEGLREGVLDWILPVKSHGFGCLVIEFKVPGKASLKDQQAEQHDLHVKHGNLVAVCTDAEAAIRTVKGYLEMEEV